LYIHPSMPIKGFRAPGVNDAAERGGNCEEELA
jgi:hypothetical protein